MNSDDLSAKEKLFTKIYSDLRGLAEQQLRSEREGHTLTPTALVHEAYVRMLAESDATSPGNEDTKQRIPESKSHFFRLAARAMRRILIESARRKLAKKRGERPIQISLQDDAMPRQSRQVDLCTLNDALEELEAKHPDLAELVTLRYFGGLTMAEVAEAMSLSLRTAERNWSYAKAWLQAELDA